MLEDAGPIVAEQPEAWLPASELPELPPEVWRAIAKATLAACGSSLGAWLQLRAMSRDWWHALEGKSGSEAASAQPAQYKILIVTLPDRAVGFVGFEATDA